MRGKGVRKGESLWLCRAVRSKTYGTRTGKEREDGKMGRNIEQSSVQFFMGQHCCNICNNNICLASPERRVLWVRQMNPGSSSHYM